MRVQHWYWVQQCEATGDLRKGHFSGGAEMETRFERVEERMISDRVEMNRGDFFLQQKLAMLKKTDRRR